jgi:NAD(P)-dependent dehydrogenase (short-subunit alcohol dehydrogenase family)
MGSAFEPLLRKAQGTPRIVNVTSGAGSIGYKVDPNGMGSANTQRKIIQYSASKAAMNMVSATQFVDFGKWGCKVFTYCPGHTVSNLSLFNTLKAGGKPTSEGAAAPIVDMPNGKRDDEAGKYLKHGIDSFPW